MAVWLSDIDLSPEDMRMAISESWGKKIEGKSSGQLSTFH